MKRIIKADTFDGTDAYNDFTKAAELNWSKGPGEVDRAIKEIRIRHRGDADYEEAYRRWAEEHDEDEEDLEPEILYVIKDRNGNQLSRPNPDDSELWDRVESMEARGRRGLSVVVYQALRTDQ